MSATPAADPIDSMLPPTPAVSVTRSHWFKSISGCICSTATMTGMLSTMADRIPTSVLAIVGPNSTYMYAETMSR